MKKQFKFYFLWLCIILIGIFIFQALIPGFTDLFVLNQRALYSNEYWRFVSAIFMHANLLHLIYNLFALFFFGLSLERLIGSRRFLIVFFASGIIANIISINFYPSSLGASGAIYGIIGCLTILRPLMITFSFGVIMPMFIASILWIIGDLIGIFTPSNIGNIAHLSGIAVGFLIGFLFRQLKKSKVKEVVRKRFVFPENYMRQWEERHIR